MNNYPTAFISYSWEDEEHKKWVKDLASKPVTEFYGEISKRD
jgi:hypothetical protein